MVAAVWSQGTVGIVVQALLEVRCETNIWTSQQNLELKTFLFFLFFKEN